MVVLVVSVVSFRSFRFVVSGFSTCQTIWRSPRQNVFYHFISNFRFARLALTKMITGSLELDPLLSKILDMGQCLEKNMSRVNHK